LGTHSAGFECCASSENEPPLTDAFTQLPENIFDRNMVVLTKGQRRSVGDSGCFAKESVESTGVIGHHAGLGLLQFHEGTMLEKGQCAAQNDEVHDQGGDSYEENELRFDGSHSAHGRADRIARKGVLANRQPGVT
jgi:hypothetical protein